MQNRSRMQSRARYHEKGDDTFQGFRPGEAVNAYRDFINDFQERSTFPLVVGEIGREERGEKGKKVGNWDTQGRMWELVHSCRQERGVRSFAFSTCSELQENSRIREQYSVRINV